MVITFDTRARILATEIGEDWDPDVKKQWLQNASRVREEVIHEFGASNFERKIEDFKSLEASPFSVIALHNQFLAQIRSAYVAGAYYPALLGAAGLGERILNHLILTLRDDYSGHPATSPEIATHKSHTNWKACIKALEGWSVIEAKTADAYRQLVELRNSAVHYRRSLDGQDAHSQASRAIELLQGIIEDIFSPHDNSAKFIPRSSGNGFISKDAEQLPLVKHFYIPAAYLVSPRFEMRPSATGWFDVYDDPDYQLEQPSLSDEDFVSKAATRGQ